MAREREEVPLEAGAASASGSGECSFCGVETTANDAIVHRSCAERVIHEAPRRCGNGGDQAPSPLECHLCHKVFTRKDSRLKHLRNIHSVNKVLPRKNFSGNKSYQCNVCLKGFECPRNLRRHTLIHTGEKPYVCDICSRDFNQSDSLKRHLATHN